METNDYWTHVGLAVGFLVTVVAPRMFNGDYSSFTAIYIVGATVLIGAATFFRLRGRARVVGSTAIAESRPADS